MNLPSRTSKLLELQQAAETELNVRFSKIFKKHRRLAFVHRQDHLFTEHWTPELAAAGYDFTGYELHGEHVVLHGQEHSSGFTYRISISFPQDLADKPKDIDAYFKRQFTDAQSAMKKNPQASSSASQSSAVGR